MKHQLFLKFSLLIFLSVQYVSASVSQKSAFYDCDQQCQILFKQLNEYARNGNPNAQTVLALAYKSGEMTPPDSKKAWYWIKKANYQDFAPAFFAMSNWYRDGFGVPINLTEANKYLNLSAERNFTPAMLYLGKLNYFNKKITEAKKILTDAAKLGSYKAKLLLNKIISSEKPINSQLTKIDKDNNIQSKSLTSADIEGELLTIIANKQDPIVLLENMMLDIRESGLYNHHGTTGSRISDRECGQRHSACGIVPRADYDRKF